MLEALLTFFSLIPFYLLGSTPTGKLIAARQGIDIYKEGSGNQGATNVARSVGKKAGILTLLFDCLKGFLCVAIAELISDDISFIALAGLAGVAGHCFSIPGKLKGGKGVATALGVFLGFSFSLTLFAISIFALVFISFRIVSAASVSAALLVPVASVFLQTPQAYQMSCAAISLIVVFRHKDNLQRLIEGREAKFQTK